MNFIRALASEGDGFRHRHADGLVFTLIEDALQENDIVLLTSELISEKRLPNDLDKGELRAIPGCPRSTLRKYPPAPDTICGNVWGVGSCVRVETTD